MSSRREGGRPPLFSGNGVFVAGEVREAMRKFYQSTDVPPFLDSMARQFVAEGRDHFHRFDLANRFLVESGGDTRLFLWSGDDVLQTLRLELLRRGMASESEEVCLRIEDRTPEAVREMLQRIIDAPPGDAVSLAMTVPNTRTEKHDRLISDDLCAREYAARFLRPAEMRDHLRKAIGGERH